MSLKRAADLALDIGQSVIDSKVLAIEEDSNAVRPKQEIVLVTRWLSKSEMRELEKWTSPSQNGKDLFKLNGKENLNTPLSDLHNFEMILIDISNSDNLQWLQYNIDYIRESPEKYNVTLVYGKWQSEQSFFDELNASFSIRKVPVRCKDKDTFYHMLHSNYINKVKPGCFRGLKSLVSFLLGRA